MFTFLARRRGRRVPAPRPRSRLWLEGLERRDCPSAPAVAVQATVLPNHYVQLSGTVSDCNLSSVEVSFGGMVMGTAYADSSGQFNFTTNQANLGTVSASAVDATGASSNLSYTNLSVAPPSVTAQVSYGAQQNVTVSGVVSDIDPGGRTVQISGAVNGSVTTNADGSYSFTAPASGQGTVSVSTTDGWGQNSNTAQAPVSTAPPVINNFTATLIGNNVWTFAGQVSDVHPAGLSVKLGGLSVLAGVTATVDSTGWFHVNVSIPSGTKGTATAVTTDGWGLTSNTAWTTVNSLYYEP